MHVSALTWLLTFGLLVGAVATGLAAEKTFVLEEHLNRSWQRELVTYLFEAPQGQCAVDSLALTGPAGPQPVQASEVELWPGTESLKWARISFLVDELAPLATQTYTLTYGPQATTTPAPAGDLQLAPTPEAVEVTTSRFGARLLLGDGTYPQPVAADQVPGPVRALRLPDGTWFGGSRLYGPTPIKSWSSRLVDAGPVFARTETRYTYADDSTLTVRCRLGLADYSLLVDMEVSGNHPDDGWELLLNQGITIPGGTKLNGARYLAREAAFTLDQESAATALYLNPWPGDGWFPDSPSLLRLALAGRAEELYLTVREPGAWAEPNLDAPWINFANWAAGMPGTMWGHGWSSRRLPLLAAEGGALLRMNLLPGVRKFAVGAGSDPQGLMDTFLCKGTGFYTPLPRLNEIKDMVLAWPDRLGGHPALFANAATLASLGNWNAAAYRDMRDPDKLRDLLNRLGELDYMRNIIEIAVRYDAVIDLPEITPEERKLLRAQTAYLGYLVADPFHWSYERGYCSGNPNMTVSRYVNLAFLGFAMRDNPDAEAWAQYGVDWTRWWLENVTDESGSWPESSHYARVSWMDMVDLAIVARYAGMYDFFADPSFKRMAIFYEKTLTPPNPLRRVAAPVPSGPEGPRATAGRVVANYGRGNRGDVWAMSGLLAAATAVSDPEFSRVMQWSWREAGYNEFFSHNTGGMAPLFVNRFLPTQVPDWRSEYYPNLGYLLRDHVGQPEENYLLFITRYQRSADGEIWPPDTGAISNWFALGKPVGASFVRVPELTHPFTVNRVALAANWDPQGGQPSPPAGYVTDTAQEGFSLLPGVDYVSTAFTVKAVNSHGLALPADMPAFPKRDRTGAAPYQWQRQLLRVSRAPGSAAHYLILRDTVAGNQPTQWQFWTLTEKLGAAEEAADRAAFLADKPGAAIAPARELRGDRLTAVGQFGVDLDYYLAAPTDTPRYTLRYGLKGGAYGTYGYDEYLDLLYLQREGDGEYFVALYPHPAEALPPTFSTLGNGTVIKVAGPEGADYCFLSQAPITARAEAATFTGTAGVVQDQAGRLALVLSAPGSVRYREYGLAAETAAWLEVGPYGATVRLPEGAQGAAVTLTLPGTWRLSEGQPTVRLTAQGEEHTLTFPAGRTRATLVRPG